jgi:putative membrane protein
MHIPRIANLAFFVSATLALGSLATSAQDSYTSRPGASQPTDGGNSTVSDQGFLKEAADGGMAEVELGQLAMEKASSSDVKEFAQRMITDHGKANDQIKQIALRKSIQLPSEPSAKNRATKARLAKLSGEQFDKAYMSDMLEDHKKDVAAFKAERTNGHDPDIKHFAAETLPTLEDHLRQAETVNPKVAER